MPGHRGLASFVREPEATASPSGSSEPEGEPPVVRSFDTIKELAPNSSRSPSAIMKPGSSSGTDIKHPLKCEPLNFGLPRQMSESYPWQPE